MKKIGILDDVKLEALYIKGKIENYSAKTKQLVTCEIFLEIDTLKEYLESGNELDILFLDIELGTAETGIEVARWVNEHARGVSIVFLTGYLIYATDVYETRHLYYVLKEELAKRLPSIFDKLDQDMRYEKIVLRSSGKVCIYRQDEIMYAERALRVTQVHLVNGETVRINTTIGDLERELNPVQFVRCHNSVLVNFAAVKEMSRTHLILHNKAVMSISRRYLENVRQKFGEWAREW